MIQVSHLTKYYGDHLAVEDLSFEIDGGHIYGFLGPNGAGKSTTMNIIAGCLSATEGQVCINGFDIFEDPIAAKKCIGYLPEQPPLYGNLSSMDYLQFVGEAKGLRGQELKEQIEQVLEKTGIAHVKNRRICTLSKGYRQRVGIAQALLGNPQVIILDEPTVGLDPLQILEIRELIKTLGQTHTIIFSSHILSEVQALCDRILIISGGRLVAFDKPENLEKRLRSGNEIHITTEGEEAQVRSLLETIPQLTEIRFAQTESSLLGVSIVSDAENIYHVSKAIFNAFSANNMVLLELSLNKANLEDIFLELTDTGAHKEEEPA